MEPIGWATQIGLIRHGDFIAGCVRMRAHAELRAAAWAYVYARRGMPIIDLLAAGRGTVCSGAPSRGRMALL
jgi:hypothetical protein